MTRIVHAADIHLDSPLLGLERYDGAPVARIRGATRRALENLVALALEERASLVLIAGDVYDGDWRDYNTGLFFCAQMSRLREAGIPVVMVRGNHDAASQIARHLRLPDNVRELGAERPETLRIDRLGLAVHGQSYAEREVTDDLAAGYPDPVPGLFNVGLLHTAVSGREGHAPYAPCSLQTLIARGYDYWALGHVHAREVLSREPWVVFPGNVQGRHARETGPKGCTLVTVEDGRVRSVEHRDLDVVRWTVCEVDATDAPTPEAVVDRARAAIATELRRAGGRSLAARLVVQGACPAHARLAADPDRWIAELRAAATDVGWSRASGSDTPSPDDDTSVWVEQVRLRTRAPIDVDAVVGRSDTPLGGLLRSIASLRTDRAGLRGLLEEFDDLRRRVPHELRRGPDAIDLDDPETLREVLDEVEQLLLPRLMGPDELAVADEDGDGDGGRAEDRR